MWAGDYLRGFQLAAGAVAFSVALAALIGRWVSADENWPGVLVRAALVTALSACALRRLGTAWYWLMLPLVLAPAGRWRWGRGRGGSIAEGELQSGLADAWELAAEQPLNPAVRLHLGRALLATGQIEAGLAALDEAVTLADEADRPAVSRLAATATQEFVVYCPRCGRPNRAHAGACRGCGGALSRRGASRLLLCLCRPALRRLRPRV